LGGFHILRQIDILWLESGDVSMTISRGGSPRILTTFDHCACEQDHVTVKAGSGLSARLSVPFQAARASVTSNKASCVVDSSISPQPWRFVIHWRWWLRIRSCLTSIQGSLVLWIQVSPWCET